MNVADLKTIELVSDCICGTAYLACPALLCWGARYATCIPGWSKLTALLLVAAGTRLFMIFSYFNNDLRVTAAWSVLSAFVCIAMTILLWEVVSRKEKRFAHLPSESATEYIDKVPFPACIVGENGQALAVNERYSQLMGVTMRDLENEKWMDFVHVEDRKRIASRWMDFIEKRSDNYTETFRWKHPEKGWMRVRGIGHVNGKCVFCSIQNISSTVCSN